VDLGIFLYPVLALAGPPGSGQTVRLVSTKTGQRNGQNEKESPKSTRDH
jgi:hypothetical protein